MNGAIFVRAIPLDCYNLHMYNIMIIMYRITHVFMFSLQPFLSDLGQLLKESSDDELCVEALGILANLNLPDIDFQRVVTQLDLLPYVISKLKV